MSDKKHYLPLDSSDDCHYSDPQDETQGPTFDVLHADFDTLRINHKSIYSGPHGENTNQAESYFARFRRMQYGQHHRMDNTYMLRYANEIAYREDTRRISNGAIFVDVMGRCARKPVSRDFCGYWQGNHKRGEELVG